MHLFFTKAPDPCKSAFPMGVGYTKAYQEKNDLISEFRKTKVSMKITAIIIGVEMIMDLSVAVFMIVLFPDLRNIFADSIGSQNLLQGILTDPISESDLATKAF